jgi:N-acetylglucosaminyl-diphospho-decaprenol L-rhamnosyltransferase
MRAAPAGTTVIVVNWNTRHLLAECLRSLEASVRAGTLETLVVDNASTDGSAEMVHDEFTWATLIANEENVGFARANNQAIARSSGDLVVLLNSDTVVRDGAIETMARYLSASPATGAVAPRLVAPDGTLQSSCSHAPTPTRELVHLAHLDGILPGLTYRLDRWCGEHPRDVEVVQGACVMVRRAVLEAVGCLDEGYFMYSEEVDLCERIRRAGWRITWLPTAEVMHHGGASTAAVPDRMFLELYASKVRFYRRNRSRSELGRFKLVVLFAAAPRIVAGLVASVLPAARRRTTVARAVRYWQLLVALPGM